MLQKYHKTTHVRYGGSYLHYTGPTYMPNQQINTAQTETHSKYCLVLYTNIFIHQVEIMKNSTCLSLFKVPNVCQRDDTCLRANRRTLQIEWTTAFTLVL